MTAAAAGLDEQRLLVRQARNELLRSYRGTGPVGQEPPIRVMARIVEELQRECAARRLDPAVVRREIVDRTIGDVDLRQVTECEGEPGGPGDFRMLADELGVALPGENINGYVASGAGYRSLREYMVDAERQLLAAGYDPRLYDIHGVGNPVLRERLAADMQHWGLHVDAQRIALGLGTTDCVDKVLRGIARIGPTPGAMLVAAPGYTLPELQATAYGYRLHKVRTRSRDSFKLTGRLLARELEKNPDITVVYLTVTNNPTAFAYSPDQLAEIRSVFREFADRGRRIHVLADLAYVGTGRPEDDLERMLQLTADPVVNRQLICLSSLSKTHTLTGERFGWVTFGSAEFATEMGASWTSSVGSLPGEWQLRFMAYHALFQQNPGLVGKIRALYRLRRAGLREQLRRHDDVHHLFEHIYLDDDATIYTWSRLRPGQDCFSVLERTGIAGIPGSTFGYSDDYIRFSVGIAPITPQ
ncbi:pyridoxal phosphate-dependent aminotransferase [Kribbella antibiotica]|uniref:Pyridoxal phosphate-dependent aminotransferase n=1 Tax=Kribbella antibiotica TaxID=190195 RepID=A0A4V2YNF5_9ACTN|nr:pyridoxal phosphate-dependent aminotransferase [Kribbella antibiotica]TDD54177.1 pyridoxal phosphate-dependent aminotransferase [Kribbella antibiotica]